MAENALQLLESKQLRLAKIGIITGIVSGMTWGASGTVLWEALNFAPFTTLLPPETIPDKLAAAGATADAAAAQYDYMVLFFYVAAGLTLAFLHDFCAALWVGGFNTMKGKFKEYGRSLSTTPGKMVCVAAIFGGPIGMSGYLLGVTFAGAVYSLPITASYPALAAVLATIFLREKNPARVWIGVAACICGSLVIAWDDPGTAPNFMLGIALATLACVGWATEGLISTYGMDMLDPDVALGIREGFSALVLGVIVLPGIGLYIGSQEAVFQGEVVTGWALVLATVGNISSPAIWLCILGGFFGGLSYVAWYRALHTCGVARAMAFNVTYAFWGVFFGYIMSIIMGREAGITGNAWVGAVVISIGAILVSINPRELFKLRD
ncbi:MAG: DMT family transporter [Candidatus Adiutrix sp.]|jgi:drug/metabolite transporter (DMT)-like permease|nr:DMT family transporter [Candidatus Adiutrix sp.]